MEPELRSLRRNGSCRRNRTYAPLVSIESEDRRPTRARDWSRASHTGRIRP